MDKERKPIITDEGYSEKQIDIALETSGNNDQVKPARNASASVAGGVAFSTPKIPKRKNPRNDLI